MNKAILIQARLSSSRFPKKMIQPLGNFTLVEYVYRRCFTSKVADQVIVITSTDETDNELYDLCIQKNIPVCRGSLNDVLGRYISCATQCNAEIVCRVCGDSPFVDVDAIDQSFHFFEENQNLEYSITTNALNGFMSEVFSLNLLKKIYKLSLNSEDKEHVTKYVRDHYEQFNTKFLNLNLKPVSLEHFSLTIDYKNDLEIARKLIHHLHGFSFESQQIIDVLSTLKGQ